MQQKRLCRNITIPKNVRNNFKEIINCKTHGLVGHFLGCPHIAEEIDHKRYGHLYEVG